LPGIPEMPALIVAYSRKGIHGEGRVVLFADSHVEFVTEQELHGPGQGMDAYKSLRTSYEGLIEQFGERLSEERKAELKRFYEVE
jgi:prepilin-type processing-associated H-X9-DG protein